jgi:hypothetical protein
MRPEALSTTDSPRSQPSQLSALSASQGSPGAVPGLADAAALETHPRGAGTKMLPSILAAAIFLQKVRIW